jgi:BirA family biotin operon repressor/biotin-[acetyl-CoA-carboxylase] ligase
MLDERSLQKTLSDLPLGGLRAFQQAGSTNDVALALAADGALDFSLIFAEEQTAGRGRGNRRWFTTSGTSLAFSLILRPRQGEESILSLFSGLGALSVCEALEKYELHPEIKWPNDVLLNRKKVCGMLVETVWMGENVDSIVLGIGINVKPESVPLPEQLIYPATCIESESEKKVDRQVLLHDILQALLRWRDLLDQNEFSEAWNTRLAFRGEQVVIQLKENLTQEGQLLGIEPDGSLRLRSAGAEEFMVQFGEVHLRPVV